jgi:hypothetical protein
VRKLTFEEAVRWKFFGPPDLPLEIEMTDAQKYWLKHQAQARREYPQFLPKMKRKRKNG